MLKELAGHRGRRLICCPGSKTDRLASGKPSLPDISIIDHSGHLGAAGSDAAMLSAASLCALALMSASVRQVSC